jgi:hypothetical protein
MREEGRKLPLLHALEGVTINIAAVSILLITLHGLNQSWIESLFFFLICICIDHVQMFFSFMSP